jgi:hypothetical protein
MKIKDLLEELEGKECYKDFKIKNPDAFFCSAMFILGDGDKADLNFFLPSKDKLSSFSMPFASVVNHPEEIKDQKELGDLDLKIDVSDLKEFIEKELEKKFTKIIAVLHNGVWNVTCLNGMDMSRMNIDAYSGEVDRKEDGLLSDMIRIKKGDKK